MTALWRSLLPVKAERSISTIDDYISTVAGLMPGYGGYPTPMPGGLTGTYGKQVVEPVAHNLEGYARLFGANSVVFTCMAVRMAVFSTIRFQWQRINKGKPSELFGTPDLYPLEEPWAGGTTQDLLTRLIQDADLAGNAYWTAVDGELVRLRPDWTQIVMTPRLVGTAQVGWRRLGYAYYEGGVGASDPAVFLADEVAHFAPQPDPRATYRGMSWLTPVVREVQNDGSMEGHRQAFFENAATPSLSVSLAKEIRPDAFTRFVEKMNLDHRGVENAYKTLYLGGGADVKVIGADFKQMDFSSVQGHGETRIAAAAGLPPVIAGFSEGLASATYSNYAQARRRFADGTMHPLWQNASGSLATLVRSPVAGGQVRLWYDARDIAFLREDRRDAADIAMTKASTMRTLIEAGFDPVSVTTAVEAEDYTLLQHSGLTSVQLQAIGSAGSDGGTGDGAAPADPALDPAAELEGETPAEIRLLMEMIQKVYLGVGIVLTAEEARSLLNRAGANLAELPADSPLIAPTEPPGPPPDAPSDAAPDEAGDSEENTDA